MRLLRRRPLTIRTRLTLWYASILLLILVVVSGLSYALLRRSLMRDVDASLQLFAHVIRDTTLMSGGSGGTGGVGGAGGRPDPAAEAVLYDLLGLEFYDRFFQVLDPRGGPRLTSSYLRGRSVPVSDRAARNAAAGRSTLETIDLAGGPTRLLTMPIVQEGRLVRLVQVGTSLRDTDQTLLRYLETLLVLIPVGLGLATIGGAAIARAAFQPITAISRTARRITAEDLSLRIETRSTGDEIDYLVGTVNAMLTRLDDAFAQMRRFAADASHELRTPLAALKGGIEVTLRTPRPAEEYRRVLESSLEEVERLARLAEDLLLLSRISADIGAGVRPARRRIELEPIILDVLDVATRLAHGTGVSVWMGEGEGAPAVVAGDPVDLQRALLNLVDNAVRYTPAGGKVEVSLTTAAGWAMIVVQDTGPGIDPADAERVFQPFVRLDAARARATTGSGLGLSIARSIVLGHGGTLTLASTPGAGSQFTIRLPLAGPAPDDDGGGEAASPPSGAAAVRTPVAPSAPRVS